jgi:hypothetical protein
MSGLAGVTGSLPSQGSDPSSMPSDSCTLLRLVPAVRVLERHDGWAGLSLGAYIPSFATRNDG